MHVNMKATDKNHPRRFYIERDNSNGRWDVVDAYRNEYVAIDMGRGRAEAICEALKRGPLN